jgi:hypothetical protein
VSWEQWNRWTLAELPRLNRAILSGGEPPEALTAQLHRRVLAGLPAPGLFSPQDARRVLVLLGLAGASVARHYQEADLSRKARPSDSFDQLAVGVADTPFLAYFAELAAITGTGHAPRDCYASLVRWNAPETRVEVDGETVARLPGSFPGLEIRTYTDDPGEFSFFELLKKSEAFELAVNDTLEPVADGTVDIRSPEAARRALAAARLMAALIRFNQDFAARPAERGGLRTEHFMDVFRQFAVHWRPGDLPPTGAQDPEFIRRDLLLGIDFPGYPELVRYIRPALLEDERVMLERCLARPTLPAVLLDSLGLSVSTLAACSFERLGRIAREHPQLAAWYVLLAANAKFGAVHLMLTEKYLFKPQRGRDLSGVGDRLLVSNRRGTTGMEEPLLVQLTRARRNHPLRSLGRLPAPELAALCGVESVEFETADLPEVRFVAVPG